MRTLLVIESSGAPVFTSRYHRIKSLGYKLIVARHDLGNDPEAEALVDHLIPVRVHNFENLDTTVEIIVREAKKLGVNGVITRWDAGVPVMVHVSAELGLPTFPPQLAEILRHKYSMRQAFADFGIPSAEFAHVQTLEQALDAGRRINYPIVLKPSLGYGSWGVVRVNSEEQMKVEFERILHLSEKEFNSSNLLIEEFLDGTELTVDSIIYQGEILFTNITEKPLPMNGEEGGFAEIDVITPSSFSESDQAKIRKVQHEMIQKIGVYNAVIHTEMRLTSKGPKLLEINPRVGGVNIPTITNLATNVDLELAALELAFGEKPTIEPLQNGYTATRIISPRQGGILRSVEGIEEIRALPGIREFLFFKQVGERILTVPYEIQDQLGYIVSQGTTHSETLATLQQAEDLLKLVIDHE